MWICDVSKFQLGIYKMLPCLPGAKACIRAERPGWGTSLKIHCRMEMRTRTTVKIQGALNSYRIIECTCLCRLDMVTFRAIHFSVHLIYTYKKYNYINTYLFIMFSAVMQLRGWAEQRSCQPSRNLGNWRGNCWYMQLLQTRYGKQTFATHPGFNYGI